MDIRNLSEVVGIDPENKTVTIKNLQTEDVYEESYDKLLLSPGARPIVPPISGIKENETLFTLRNIPDTDKIKNYVAHQNPKKAVVVGGGFIGIEMAENLVERGIEVTIIEMLPDIMMGMVHANRAMLLWLMMGKGSPPGTKGKLLTKPVTVYNASRVIGFVDGEVIVSTNKGRKQQYAMVICFA
jgi:NADPH-dependent 2,4-dienoyl-CoA reductase/sulfur reductase-like enzyme